MSESRVGADGDAAARRIGRYEIVAPIASGGMATVYLARMRGPGGFRKLVALKCVHPHLLEQDGFIEMFLDEARLAAAISHPNVASVLDFGAVDGTYFLAMELLVGETLAQLHGALAARPDLRAHPELIALVARMIGDAAEGLHAAHEGVGKDGLPLEIIHRDVSLLNVMLTYDGRTKVMDFGIARAVDQIHLTRTGTLRGTPAYMAPEQLERNAVSRRSDIWGLGVVLWELLTGARLFKRPREVDVMRAVLGDPIPPPSSLAPAIPPALDAIVAKALARPLEERFATARELAEALRPFWGTREPLCGPERLGAWLGELFPERSKQWDAMLDLARRDEGAHGVRPALAAEGAVTSDATRAATPLGTTKPRRRWRVLAGAGLLVAAVVGSLALGFSRGVLPGTCRAPGCCTDDAACGPCARCDDGACSPRTDGEPCPDGLCAGGTCAAVACDRSVRIAQVAAGPEHACAIDKAGGVWCWGRNDQGQLGLGDLRSRTYATRLALPERAAFIATGTSHGCAIDATNERRLWCWGRDREGQSGIPTTTYVNLLAPALLPTEGRWTSIAAGERHTCGIRDEAVSCWGANDAGQLGIGQREAARRQVLALDVTGFAGTPPRWRRVLAGTDLSCAIDANAATYCWGRGAIFDRGPQDDTAARRAAPRFAPERIGGALSLAVLSPPRTWHTCGLDPQGGLFCWGNNTAGELGLGHQDERLAPTRVGGGESWRAVATGEQFTCGLTQPGGLACWGSNDFGQVGVMGIGDRWTPTRVAPEVTWDHLALGRAFGCAIRSDGVLHCWGRSDSGQLGRDTTARFAPTPVCFAR